MKNAYVPTYELMDWWQTTRGESEIFGIQPELARRLVDAFSTYESLIGLCFPEVYPDGITVQQIARWKEIYVPQVAKTDNGEIIFDAVKCRMFMATEFDLPEAQCYAWNMKHEAWLFRNGITE